MRVLVATGLYPPESGGPATYAQLLHDELPRRGVKVDVLPFRKVRHLPKVFRHIAYAWRVSRMAARADVIYAQDTMSVGLPARVANLFMRRHFIVRVPGDHVWEQGTQRFGVTDTLDQFPRWSWRWHPALMCMRFLQRRVVFAADRIIVPSAYVGRIVQNWGVNPARIQVIYSGIEIPVRSHLSDETLLPPQPRIITVARLVPWKGISALIDIVAYESSWQLIVGDDGPLRATLETQAARAGAVDRVHFIGRMTHVEMMGWIKSADVFVLNSTYEGLSHLLIEAMALGVPVVATRVGGNPELIEDGVSGILVSAGDSKALHRALADLLSDGERREALAAKAQERAQQFSIDLSMAKLVTTLYGLCSKRPR